MRNLSIAPGLRCKFACLDLVYITPDPGLSGLDGAHNRMLGVVKVLGGVFVPG